MRKRYTLLIVLLGLAWACLGCMAQDVQTSSTATEGPQPSIEAASAEVQTGSSVASTDPVLLDEERTEAFQIDIDGRKTWTVRYGFGHPLGLALAGIQAGQLDLDQTLRVDFTAEALEALSVVAHLDDQQADVMQSLAVYLDTERLDGVFGDFSLAGMSGVATYNKKMLGLRLDYYFGDATLTAVASQFEGISETRTFTGDTASDTVEFSAFRPDQPWTESAYRSHIDGLYAFRFETAYVEGFTDVGLTLEASGGLTGILSTFGLAYLADVLIDHGTLDLDDGDFTAIASGRVLVLVNELADYAREILEEAIDVYNDELPDDEEERVYPFVPDSEYELDFLGRLEPYLGLSVGDETVNTTAAVRRTFYDLGATDIMPNSISVQVSSDGVTYYPITLPEFAEYSVGLHEAPGILECNFPDAFFDATDAAIRVQYQYSIAGGIFMLGLSLIPESDKVYLNGELLERNDDYTIDYEVGMLMLDASIELDSSDALRVDYEVYSGGLGGGADYASYFYGLALDLPLGDLGTLQASLLRSQDDPGSTEDPTTAQTMPNQQTVAAVSADLGWDDFSTNLSIGYNDELFPFDDNQRANEQNLVTAIAAFSKYTIVGHLDGFSVFSDGMWRAYDTGSGLSGPAVRDIAYADDTLYFATNAGLTVVRLDGVAPLDRVRNWRYYTVGDGPPNASFRSVAAVDGIVWVGTDGGLASVSADAMEDRAAWTVYRSESFAEVPAITTIAASGDAMYFGTEAGLYVLETGSAIPVRVSGTQGIAIHDLHAAGDTLYVASDRGVRAYVDGVPGGWIVDGIAAYAVLASEETVYVGTDAGLVVSDGSLASHVNWKVTALGLGAEGALWVGSQANDDYRLLVWRHAETVETFDNETALIDGRDRRHYVNVPADDHTSRGLSARISFRETGEPISVYGSIETISPEYHAIGSLSRTDSTGWTFGAEDELDDDITWTISHKHRMSDLRSDDPTARTTNQATFQWQTSFGPELSTSLLHRTVNDDWRRQGGETSYLSYRAVVRDSLFDNRLDVKLRWTDTYGIDEVAGETSRDSTLAASLSAIPMEGLSLVGGWSRPVDLDSSGWDGSETWTWGGTYREDVVFGLIAFDYGGKRVVALPERTSSWSHSFDAGVDVDTFSISFFSSEDGDGSGPSAWSITPGVDVEVTLDDALAFDSRAIVTTSRDQLSLRTTLDLEVSGFADALDPAVTDHAGYGDDVIRDLQKISVNTRYGGWEGITPSLTVSASRSASTYRGETRAGYDVGLDGRLRWVPDRGTQDTLSIGMDLEVEPDELQFKASIDNSYRTDVTDWIGDLIAAWGVFGSETEESMKPVVGLSVENALDLRLFNKPDFDASVIARMDVAVGPMWGGSLGMSYYTGLKSTGELYHSTLIELTLALDFEISESSGDE